MSDTPEREDWRDPARWARATPRAPVIGHPRRRELAAQWLAMLGCAVTDQRVDELAPVVMRYHPHSPKGHLANRIIQTGGVPHVGEVERVYRRQQALQAATTWRPDPALAATARDVADAAAAYVNQYRADPGHGPTWGELADHLNLAKAQAAPLIRALAHANVLTYTRAHRSLDVATSARRPAPTQPAAQCPAGR